MIGIHACTGCDTVSCFAGDGKLVALKLVKKDPSNDVFRQHGRSWELDGLLPEPGAVYLHNVQRQDQPICYHSEQAALPTLLCKERKLSQANCHLAETASESPCMHREPGSHLETLSRCQTGNTHPHRAWVDRRRWQLS